MAAASMVFTDCSSSPTASRLLTRTTPLLRRTTTQYGIVFPRRLINPPRSLSIHSSSSSPSQFSSASVCENEKKLDQDRKLEIVDKRLDGKKVAEKVRGEIAEEVERMKEAIGIVPGLAVILVGDRKESATYVSKKKEACGSVGFNSFDVRLPEDATEQEVLDAISGFNEDPSVHGILVQLPLPRVCA